MYTPLRAYLAHKLTRFSPKDVVHDARPAGIVLEARQQRAHSCCCVSWVQLLHHFIRQVSQLREELGQVAAHVGVWPVPHRQVRHLQTADGEARHQQASNIASGHEAGACLCCMQGGTQKLAGLAGP